jgi:cytochrome P450
VLALLRVAVDEDGRTSMTREQLRDELMTLFLAGHDTICASLLWFYYLVGTRPEVDAAIAAEVKAVCDDDDITFAHVARLKYVEAAFLEAMRLYPAIPVIARTPLADDVLGEHRVPAGSVVLLPVIWLHRDPARWERPAEFVPERFLERPKPPTGGFLPFSAGPRKCIGDQLAMVEALTIIATIARSFSLRVEPGFVPRAHTSITMQPENGLMVRRTRRSSRPDLD